MSIRPPDEDPFYLPAPAFEARRPGGVLAERQVLPAAFGRVPVSVDAWQLQYRTTDLTGAPEAATTTVLFPRGEYRGLMSFQCAIDAVTPRCAPSYALRLGARAAGSLAQLELGHVVAALRRGWVVSIPDHCGPGGRLGAAREPGYRVLDGLRAARRFGMDGGTFDLDIGLWGYSGGGLATAWAAEAAADYAPELPIVGAVAGSPVGDPGNALRRLSSGRFVGFPVMFIAGLRRAYPRLTHVLDEHMDDVLRAELDVADERTTVSLLVRLQRMNLDDHLRDGVDGLLADPRLAAVMDDIRPGAQAPAMPMLIQQGVRDEVIAVADVDALVARYRAAGARIDYRRLPFGTHLPLEFWTARGALDWLQEQRDAQAEGLRHIGREEVRT
ncbi:putative inactive lipase [Gordonia spumicola]|uniref:Putative inactive lipase n=1 Tax=Gordonia spumicola TaxID=589161 RepID=A0A7I9V8I3_9ACTN|nr:lipase family protein [Gordonia spumicola]GEE01410.1 putative inactive lipase [Gordonia spumicola]